MGYERKRTGIMIGTAFVILGLLITFRGGLYQLGYFVGFYGYHVPFGVVIIFVGLLFFVTAFRRKKKIDELNNE